MLPSTNVKLFQDNMRVMLFQSGFGHSLFITAGYVPQSCFLSPELQLLCFSVLWTSHRWLIASQVLHNNGTISVRAKGRGGGGSVENANKGIDATDPFPLPTRIRSSLFASLPVTNYTCRWQEAQCVTTTQLPGQGLNPGLSEIQRTYSHHIKRGLVSFFYLFSFCTNPPSQPSFGWAAPLEADGFEGKFVFLTF